MKLQKNRYYLVATRPCMKFQQTLQEGDVIVTMKGKPRSFGTIERALNWKMMHLGKEFPVKVWRKP